MNASSKDAPQVVDRHVQPVTDPMMVYSGCYCNVSVNFYAFNANGNRGVAAGLGNVQFVKDGERLSGKASAESDLTRWTMRMFWAAMPVRNCRITFR